MSIVRRIWDASKVAEAMKVLDPKGVVDPVEWVSNPVNLVLEIDDDLALFEYGLPDKRIYSAHYFFKSRGKQAMQAAKAFLDEVFNSCYNIDVIMGLTPVEHRAARWMNRRMGATSYGIEEVHGKEFELFILTKKEFNDG